MSEAQSSTYSFTPISAGVDWLTATRKASDGRVLWDDLGNALITQERAAGGDVKPATLRDYTGWRADGMFIGRRTDDSIIVLSGPRADQLHRRVTHLASNVSRLDLQVTLWTNGEQPHLAREAYQSLSTLPPRRGRKPRLRYTEEHPDGETFYYGSRLADYFGRLYDKATESNLGYARTLWRYEVEYKRRPALALARALCRSKSPSSDINSYVRSWWADRRVGVPWEIEAGQVIPELQIAGKSRDLLSWFETSLSVTLATAINRYGLDVVLEKLKLTEHVQPIPKEAKRNGRRAASSGATRRRAAQSDN